MPLQQLDLLLFEAFLLGTVEQLVLLVPVDPGGVHDRLGEDQVVLFEFCGEVTVLLNRFPIKMAIASGYHLAIEF